MRWCHDIWCVYWMSISRCRDARSPDPVRRSHDMIDQWFLKHLWTFDGLLISTAASQFVLDGTADPVGDRTVICCGVVTHFTE